MEGRGVVVFREHGNRKYGSRLGGGQCGDDSFHGIWRVESGTS